MESQLFDRLTQSLSAATQRRTLLSLLAGSGLGMASLASTEGKRKKKKVKVCLDGQTLIVPKKKKGNYFSRGATKGACRTGSDATCDDGVRNGSETDVDCGGSCERCALNQACLGRQDCGTALCANNVCVGCESDTQCGSDANGPCRCRFSGICNSGGFVPRADCEECPEGTVTCVFVAAGDVRCHPRCGASFA